MKAREVRERLKGRCEEQVRLVLEAIAEEQSRMRHENMQLAQMVDQLVDLVMQLGVTIERTQGAVDRVNKTRNPEGDTDSGPTRIG